MLAMPLWTIPTLQNGKSVAINAIVNKVPFKSVNSMYPALWGIVFVAGDAGIEPCVSGFKGHGIKPLYEPPLIIFFKPIRLWNIHA